MRRAQVAHGQTRIRVIDTDEEILACDVSDEARREERRLKAAARVMVLRVGFLTELDGTGGVPSFAI